MMEYKQDCTDIVIFTLKTRQHLTQDRLLKLTKLKLMLEGKMLFYRLELMTSTSLTTNITKLQGSGYLDMMRYICIFFLTSVKLDHVK